MNSGWKVINVAIESSKIRPPMIYANRNMQKKGYILDMPACYKVLNQSETSMKGMCWKLKRCL